MKSFFFMVFAASEKSINMNQKIVLWHSKQPTDHIKNKHKLSHHIQHYATIDFIN
jgi:hypothetical protein